MEAPEGTDAEGLVGAAAVRGIGFKGDGGFEGVEVVGGENDLVFVEGFGKAGLDATSGFVDDSVDFVGVEAFGGEEA